MRSPLYLVAASILVLAACSEPGVGPNDSLATAPTVQMSQVSEPGDTTSGDLCGGLSPCDAYDYRDDGSIGAPGICFLPPTVENHTSEEACSAPNRPGLGGLFQLAWCQVAYDEGPGLPSAGEAPPRIVECQDPSGWVDLEEGENFYSASVRWRRNEAVVGDVFRVYVVRGEQMFAFRDLVIDPNLTTPADGYVHAIGYGNEPIKVIITDDFSCVKYDTQDGLDQNAATCLIAGATTVSFTTNEQGTTFNFPDGNPTFLADFEVSECLPLGFEYNETSGMGEGNALVDTPLADCKISLSSEELDALTVPAQIEITLTDSRWGPGGPFEDARLNVLQYDEYGIGALPPSTDPGWFGSATGPTSSAALGWLGRGLDKLASFVLPRPLYAAFSGGWDFRRMSDFQVSVMPVMGAGSFSTTCGDPACFDLGTHEEDDTISVSVHVTAPDASASDAYPDYDVDVPDTRLHFFPQSGSVLCPSGSAQAGTYGRGCVAPNTSDTSTDPPSQWDHVVVITGTDGMATVDWALAPGENTLYVAACGVARPGPSEPDPTGEPGTDRVWGDLGDCTVRDSITLFEDGDDRTVIYDNGPADGVTPFEPVDTAYEAALYTQPLTFKAATCGGIVIDGDKDDTWGACADAISFTAPVKGPKVEDNATLYTYSDGDALYIGIEVTGGELGSRMFVNLTEVGGSEAAGDEILVLDELGNVSLGAFEDWHLTAQCLGNNAASLCGAPDQLNNDDGTADEADGAGKVSGNTVFYEFVRPFGSDDSVGSVGVDKEDLAAGEGDEIGLKVTLTQGQGGGKGGFVFPDPQTSSTEYFTFTID